MKSDGLTVTVDQDGTIHAVSAAESDGSTAGPIMRLTAEGHAEQDGTPTPDSPVEIQTVTGHEVTGKTGRFVDLEAQGKNLWKTAPPRIANGITFTINNDGSVVANGTAEIVTTTASIITLPAGSYIISGSPSGGSNSTYNIYVSHNGTIIARDFGEGATLTTTEELSVTLHVCVRKNYVASNLTFYPQLELGTKATPYEPYYYSTTPIPLPSRGWVGSLPDGTADVLTLDGAGKVTWEEATNEITLDGGEVWSNAADNNGARVGIYLPGSNNIPKVRAVADGSIIQSMMVNRFDVISGDTAWGGNVTGFSQSANGQSFFIADGTHEMTPAYLKTWLSTHPVTVLYPLATPVTEEMGYIDLPDIPEGASISIPELDALNVRYIVDDAAAELARMWYERAYAELGDAIVELAGRVATLENA